MKRRYFLSPLFLQKIIWIPTRLLLIIFGHLKVRGLENIRNIKGNAIFAANHASELDPILLPASLPFFSHFSPIFYTSRERKFYKLAGWRQRFYGGSFFKAWGAYPVLVGLHDYEKSMANHLPIVQSGGNLCIFPEGRITPDGHIRPAKGGISYLANATGRPVIPVHYDGTFKLSLRDFFLGRRHLTVTFGKPMYMIEKTESYLSAEDFKNHANSIMKEIARIAPVGAFQPDVLPALF